MSSTSLSDTAEDTSSPFAHDTMEESEEEAKYVITEKEMEELRKTLAREYMKQCAKAFEWIFMRQQSLKMMRDTADKIDKHYRNVNISRIAGTSTAIAGGAMAVGGTVATIATAGAAAPITAPIIAAGTAISIAGGGTSAGASIADVNISKLKLSDVQKQIDADNEMLEKLMKLKSENVKDIKISYSCANSSPESIKVKENEEVLEAPKPEKKGVEATFSTTSSIARAGSGAAAISYAGGKGAVKLGEAGVQVAKVGGQIAKGGAAVARVGRVALQKAAVGSIAVGFAVIPLNIAEIVMSGISLYKGSETKAGRRLRENADKYEEQMRNVMKIYEIPESVIND